MAGMGCGNIMEKKGCKMKKHINRGFGVFVPACGIKSRHFLSRIHPSKENIKDLSGPDICKNCRKAFNKFLERNCREYRV
jgi:hypothetical protein